MSKKQSTNSLISELKRKTRKTYSSGVYYYAIRLDERYYNGFIQIIK